MDVKNILAHCDHTLLKQESTWAQIKEVCDDGLKYGCASVCIPILLHSIFNTHAVYEALMMHVREFYGIRLFIAVPPFRK